MDLRKGTDEHNCKSCKFCEPFEIALSEYKGKCTTHFNALIKATTVCEEYVYDEKFDSEAKRILLRNW